jgi:hypothetical protein
LVGEKHCPLNQHPGRGAELGGKGANATLLDLAGAPLSMTQALLGDSSSSITGEIYLCSIPADERNAVVKMEMLIEDIQHELETAALATS